MAHNLAGGVIVVKDDEVLLVKDKYGWSLPKGSTEAGEIFSTTAKRESFEETGYHLVINSELKYYCFDLDEEGFEV